jgi:hypothetical protein
MHVISIVIGQKAAAINVSVRTPPHQRPDAAAGAKPEGPLLRQIRRSAVPRAIPNLWGAVRLRSRSMADAGRALFGARPAKRSMISESDRLRKLLQRFGPSWFRVGSNIVLMVKPSDWRGARSGASHLSVLPRPAAWP